MSPVSPALQRLAGAATAATLLAGCTGSHYLRSADRAAYGLIKDRTPAVRNMDPAFTIEQSGAASVAAFPKVTAANPFLGADGMAEVGGAIVTLDAALQLAVSHSRTYQSRKEQLYLSALSLSLTRHQYTPLFSGNAGATYSVTREQKIVDEIDAITGAPVPVVRFSDNERITGSGTLGAGWLVRDVGRISASITTDFIRFITGDPSLTSASQLTVSFLRPLLRDAGYRQQAETLIQAERQMLYDLRDFTQFRKDFSVQVATSYYRVLGSRDAVRTSFINLDTSRRNAARTSALAAEGRATQADLGRLQQQELSAESSWLNAVRAYRQQLDSFKIQIGLSVDTNIVLDDRELAALQIGDVDIGVEESIEAALAGRLDYLNARDRLEDATRRVAVAAGTLLPRLDLSSSATMSSDPGDSEGFVAPDPDRLRWNAGLSLDPGLDKTAERNGYRAAVITRNSAMRAVEQQEDTIKLNVRESWRTLEQARRSYQISEASVRLAERRVEEQTLRAELGSARAQDQVDAQNALIDSQNQRSQALVNHMIARLGFWNNIGLLFIRPDGRWEELEKPSTPTP